MKLPRPFLKWAGGKGQLVTKLLELIPSSFGDYYEPFLGGGAMFFALYRQGLLKDKKVYLSDINKELITTYIAVRDHVDDVIKHLKKHVYDKEYYLAIRALNPDDLSTVEIAARMIYLNRTGFNGLYRVNKKGMFNVPFGKYKNPTICDEENLRAVSKALYGVDLYYGSFEHICPRLLVNRSRTNKSNGNSFIYCDPPYMPVSKASFTAYSKRGFDLLHQRALAYTIDSCSSWDIYVMLSNSDTPIVRELYKEYTKIPILARRSINSSGTGRGKVGELVIINYVRS